MTFEPIKKISYLSRQASLRLRQAMNARILYKLWNRAPNPLPRFERPDALGSILYRENQGRRGFKNYHQPNLRMVGRSVGHDYRSYVAELAQKHERKRILKKTGQVLLWHGILVHGGDRIAKRELSRKSTVVHYMPPSFERGNEIRGPFRC
jgi:hypothetical protein